jgi:hypothetical protein
MKRRSFLTGLLASSALLGVTLKSEVMNIIKPKTGKEEFYEFFEKFNGFSINENQKLMYSWYTKDYGIVTLGRQMGVSTLLITLAAFLNKTKNTNVLHVSTNYKLAGYFQEIYLKNNNGISNGVYFGWADKHGGKETDGFFDIVLYDNSGDYAEMYNKYYSRINHGKFMLGTSDIDSDFKFNNIKCYFTDNKI